MKTNKLQTSLKVEHLVKKQTVQLALQFLKGKNRQCLEFTTSMLAQSGSRKQRHLQGATLEKEELC